MVRMTVAEMTHRALELQAPHWARLGEDLLVPDAAERLDEVRAPPLVVVGDEDVEDMHMLASGSPPRSPTRGLRRSPAPPHVPSLEQPEAFDTVVLAFLADVVG